MRHILKISLVISLLFLGKLQAQTDAEKKINKQMDNTYCLFEVVEPNEDYKNAEALVAEAITKLKAGSINEADATIKASIASYPTINVFDYVREICLLPDINKANIIMDLLNSKLESMSDAKLFLLDEVAKFMENGVMKKKVRLTDRNRVIFSFGIKTALVNKEFGALEKYRSVLKKTLTTNFGKKCSYDTGYFESQSYSVELAKLEKDYDKAIQKLEAIDIPWFSNDMKNPRLVDIYIAKGDYETAKKTAESKSKKDFLTQKDLFKINTLLGNNELALENFKKYSKEFEERTKVSDISNDCYYYLAIIDLNKKDYQQALNHLNEALNNKSKLIWAGKEGLIINKYEVYKAMGDAYAGLKQFEKARDAYNLSLLFNADYEPAQMALAQLESVVATTTATDKTPPTITVTEPANTRGLEIIAKSNDILVKGVAQDPSGLKSVTINGQAVFAQASGDFWGNVNLKEGANQITIVATDGAGNSATQTFTIQRKAAAVDKGIVLATKKEGKNYCLLIGAQNYNDLSIPSLENPIQDAIRLKLILKKDYSFDESNIISLFNPTANDIKRQLLELSTSIAPEDNLVIFYAGHGTWAEKEKKGYWLLVDAKRNDPNTWLPNKDVLTLIAKLPSRHTLLITDACFSGGVFKTRSLGKDAPLAVQTLDEKISRVAITSGNDTEVPDESVFMKYLIKALTDNKEKYLTAQKMFITQIMEAVMTETKTEPRYGTLELAGHVGGDYIFAKK